MRRLLPLLAVTVSTAWITPAAGAVLTVRNLRDSGTGSLRAAIASAHAGDTVSIRVRGTILVHTALSVARNLTIRNDVGTSGEISGGDATRILHIAPGVTAALTGVNLVHGRVTDTMGSGGGAVFNEGTLAVTNSSFFENESAGDGGALYNTGTLALTGTLLGSNSADGEGGALFSSGTLNVTGCALFDNHAMCGGGVTTNGNAVISQTFVSLNDADVAAGIQNNGVVAVKQCTISYNQALAIGAISNSRSQTFSGSLTISESTLANNSALTVGGIGTAGNLRLSNCTLSQNSADAIGAINTAGTAILLNCTVALNHATSESGGITNVGGLTLGNTIVAGNTAAPGNAGPGPDLFGAVTSLGHNLISNTRDASGFVATDLLNVSPRLGPLQDNGGPTPTHPLLAGSPALDAGDNALIDAAVGAFDQRGPGFARIVAGSTGTPTVDIGAIENQGADLALTDKVTGRARVGAVVTFTLTLRNLGPEAAEDAVIQEDLPRGVVFLTARTSAGTLITPAVGAHGFVTAYIPAVLRNQVVQVAVTVQVLNHSGQLGDHAVVSSPTFDPNGSNGDTAAVVPP